MNSLNRMASATLVSAFALTMAGCSTVSKTESNDPCYGFLVTPNTATNSDMIRQSAGVVQPRQNTVFPRPRGVYHGFGAPVHYNTFFNNAGKPSELVFTVTSVNGIRHDVKSKNNSSEFLTWGLALVGGAAGSKLGGAEALIGAVGGAFLGRLADGGRNDGVAESTKACIRDIQAGGQDPIPVRNIPSGQRLPVPQAEDRGLIIR